MMPSAGEPPTRTPYESSQVAGMLRFLARFSGRRRHVWRSSGPGAATSGETDPETSELAVSPHRGTKDEEEEEIELNCSENDEEKRRRKRPMDWSLNNNYENISNRKNELHKNNSKENNIRHRKCCCNNNNNHHSNNNYNISTTTTTTKDYTPKIHSYLATLLIISSGLIGMADACSSRSTPKPRPPQPTPRPNITFHMYTCPPDYAEWYCLNGATCFTVKIVDSLLYNCLCSNGYIGQRCEFKDLDGSYLPSRQRVMLETASIAGAVTIAVFLAVITFISIYIHCKRKQKELRLSGVQDVVDSPCRDPELRPFCGRNRSLMIFMTKNPDNMMTMPSIEQTKMSSWNNYPLETTRMTSVNETFNKRPSL